MIEKIKDWWDDVDFMVKYIAVCLLVVALCVWGAVGINKATCDRYQSLSPDFHWSFSIWGGCLVETHSGRWISPNAFFQLEQVTP